MAAERRWPRPLGVRWQATLVAVATVGLTLVLGAVGLVVLTQRRLQTAIETTTLVKADGIVAIAEAGTVSDPLPGRDPEVIAQIVDATGRVIAADRAAQALPPMAEITVAGGERRIIRLDSLANQIEPEVDVEDAGPFVVVAEGVTLAEGPATVLVAASLEDATTARSAFVPLLGIGLPLVLVVVGMVTWVLTGRSLRPVDAMRREAERISALALDVRLPEPEARDELHRLARTLNDMLERLEHAATQQRQFVGDASHELKSPLTSLRAMVDVAARDPEAMDVSELVYDLDGEVARMERLVSDLLVLAAHDEGANSPASVMMDLAESAATIAASAPMKDGVTIDISGLSRVVVVGRPSPVEQAIRNVVENAVRHASSTVWLSTSHHQDKGVLAVSDDGQGVPAESRDRIFERFVRVDESRARRTGGTGLGLAVARAAARALDGDVRIGASRHGGATFEILLPLAEGDGR